MSTNATTLSGAINSTDTRVRLASGTGAAVGKKLRVDDEFMDIVNVDASPSIDVARGVNSEAKAHANLAQAVIGEPGDFPTQKAPGKYSYGAAGAISKESGTHILMSGAASAMTIPDPVAGDEGKELLVVADTAHAYTLTNTTGFNAGGAGADELTFGGAVGDNVRIKCVNGRWMVIATRNVTLA
jgi:hypothetical protein